MPDQNQAKSISAVRLYAGLCLIALSLVLPVFSIVIIGSTLPAWLKASLVGLVSIGGPEVLAFIAIAILGKEAFDLLMAKVVGLLKRFAPAGPVGKIRYYLGLTIMLLTFVPSVIMAYIPQWLPDSSPWRIYICVAADLGFLISLFIAGGDFWDKLRALFIFEAKASFPEPLQDNRATESGASI
ncbi:MAG: hypothetical protein K8F91_13815 [Candidatus Obscuribacterales bacterium]|nr:hypothetical protein [Candidatus Obscuribacterales bacterium]